MRASIARPAGAVAMLFAIASGASAQGEWTYRGRVAAEATSTALNTSGLFVATADSTWDDGRRLRVGSGLIFTGEDGRFDVRAREAFARISATPWMDVEAGKRLLRWGVGYGFAPTGVLDPARVATDPTDRLGQNDGIGLARVDLFRGDSSVTVAAAEHRVLAARARTVVRGVELAVVGRAAAGARPAWGGNLTHVVGQRLEWHAEFLSHERPAAGVTRTVSAVLGLQYTFAAGANVVLEYHRDGRGPDSLFLRAARSGVDAVLAPELIVIRSLDDGGWTVVPAMTWTPHARVQVYARAVVLAGPDRSVVSFAPWSRALTLGTAVRF